MSAPSRWWESFGLREAPFTKELPDADLWLPPSKEALLDTLLEALHARANVLLVGEPGVGKTCVLRALRQRLGPDSSFALTYAHNVTLGRRDFYRTLCFALGLHPVATAGGVFAALHDHVQSLTRERRIHPVLLLDEAHLTHQDLLDHLHILLNFEWDSRALLSLVLVGLPELEDRLDTRRNRSLATRITYRLQIEPLTVEDTASYLQLRLARVGCTAELFARDAVTALHSAAAGAHRDIDRLATLALRETSQRRRKVVDRDSLAKILSRQEARE